MDTMYDYNDGMYGVNFIELDKNVKLLERRTIPHKGCIFGACRTFNTIMRAFSNKSLEAITYMVFLNAPIMKFGTVTFYRDGNMTMRVATPEEIAEITYE